MSNYDFFTTNEEILDIIKITDYVEDAEVLPTQSYQIGLQLAEADREYNKLHEKRKAEESKLYWKLKSDALNTGTKLSIKDVESIVDSDESINKLKQAEIDAKYESDRLRAVANALNQKGMLLQSIIKLKTGGMH